jgi:hypothetical protein
MPFKTHRGLGWVTCLMALVLGGCAPVQGFGHDPACTRAATDSLSGGIDGKLLEYYKDPKTPLQTRTSYRNSIVYGRMALSECSYNEFQARLWGDTNIISLGADLTVLTLAGLGATTGSPATASALAAASAGVVGAQAAISKDLYYQRTLPALMAQMTANRETVKAAIIANLQKDDDAYPLSRAEIDLAVLARASGLPAAIENVTETATKAKIEAEKNAIKASAEAPEATANDPHIANLNNHIRALLNSTAPADTQELNAISAVLKVSPQATKTAWRDALQDAIGAKVNKDGWASLVTDLKAAGVPTDKL